MRILVTSFEPFGGERVNSSYEAVQLLPGSIEGADIIKICLPVSFETAGPRLVSAMDTFQPEIVICVGQAGGSAEISVERVAINLQDASIPDNCGLLPKDQPVIPGGPAAYFSALPVKELFADLQASGIPVRISYSAGTFVCNTVMYTLLHRIHLETRTVIGGFIHVPYLAEQAQPKGAGTPGMERTQIARGLEIAVRSTLKSTIRSTQRSTLRK